MDRELLRFRGRHHASLHPPNLLSSSTALCDKARADGTQRLTQEHDCHALADPDPVAHLVVYHISQQSAASTHEFHPIAGHSNVFPVLLQFDLYIVVTSPIAARADLKQTALQVVLQLVYALRAPRFQM